MCEAGASRFRQPKTTEEEQIIVYKAIPASTKYKNKWATLSLNYCPCKFVMEVAKKSGERYPPKTVYGISVIQRSLEEKKGAEALNPLDNYDRR